jgi:ElaB/YqjD/DUF883 family membrane-anchored ribosome-binding protein
MAETTADVRRDIELTRERMSSTLAELEDRLNVMQFVKDHPWPAIAVAAGAGFALSGSGADVKAAAATATAAHAATDRTSRLGPGLDEVVARLLGGVQQVLMQRADELVEELRGAIGVKGDNGQARQPAMSRAEAPQRASHASPAPQRDAYEAQRQLGDVSGGASRATGHAADPYGASTTRAD